MNKKIWFKKKSYGWGWTPYTWEAWVTTFIIFSLMIYLATHMDTGKAPFIISFISLAALYIFISYIKGEKVNWNKFKQD